MTNDEIAECINFLLMEEQDGVSNARFARDMAEEVLQLRAELAALAPLAEAAVALKQLTDNNGSVIIDEFTIEHVPSDQITGNPLVAHGGDFLAGLVSPEVTAYARAQAQDGAA